MVEKDYTLAAFADEADPSLAGQIAAMKKNGIRYLEMRGVNGKNVSALTAAEAKEAVRQLTEAGISVWSLGSPAGKTPITDPFEKEEETFKRLLETAAITGARYIRLFSFYGTGGNPDFLPEVARRLDRFCELAKGSGVTLCHENEKGIYGEKAEACKQIHMAVPALGAVFDPANFVQAAEDVETAWETLAPYVVYGHIKDALPDGRVVPPGSGAGALHSYLPHFFAMGCRVLTMEPHLAEFVGLGALEKDGDRSAVGGYHFANGEEAFTYATDCLKSILREI